MKFIAVLTLAIFLGFSAIGQTPKVTGPSFDVVDFNKKAQIAEWLVQYDEVAWKTSDVVMKESKDELAKLGGSWFCYQDSQNLWHAYYGKLAGDSFDPVFHYTFDRSGKITRLKENGDQKLLNSYAKALALANAKLETVLSKGAPRFNQYIWKYPDDTFGVWLLPAFQPDGIAVFGGEAYYVIDKMTTKVVKEDTYFQPNFRGFKASPPREIWLDYREIEKPTLGTIFFVWYYKTYFTKINIDNAKSVSTVIKTDKDGYMWVHVEKE